MVCLYAALRVFHIYVVHTNKITNKWRWNGCKHVYYYHDLSNVRSELQGRVERWKGALARTISSFEKNDIKEIRNHHSLSDITLLIEQLQQANGLGYHRSHLATTIPAFAHIQRYLAHAGEILPTDIDCSSLWGYLYLVLQVSIVLSSPTCLG